MNQLGVPAAGRNPNVNFNNFVTVAIPNAPVVANGPEGLEDQLMKAKSVLNQPFVLVSLLYTLAIPVSLAVRTSNMSLVNARPLDTISHTLAPGPDKWVTADTLGMALTTVWFLPITMFHFYIISHLIMRRPAGYPKMRGIYAWFAPAAITFMTLAYFLSYISLARYVIQVKEWVLFCVFAALLFLGSAHIICCNPLMQSRVVVIQEPGQALSQGNPPMRFKAFNGYRKG